MTAIHVVGDVHGQLDKLDRLLRGAGLADARGRWGGGRTTLVFIGDFVDRGPHGVACIDRVMRLQRQAAAAGGEVLALLGNHDLALLAAYRFPDFVNNIGLTMEEDWLRTGGVPQDLEALTPEHVAWIQRLPAMALIGDTLLMHADSGLYLARGDSVDEVNAGFRAVLAGDDPAPFDEFFWWFSEHGAFEREPMLAELYLGRFGGLRLVHGHTPIDAVSAQRPEEVRSARVYHQGMCVNVDGGMYRGGPGFVYRLEHP